MNSHSLPTRFVVADRPHEQRRRLLLQLNRNSLSATLAPPSLTSHLARNARRLYTDRLSKSHCGLEILRTRRTIVPTTSLTTANRHLVSGRAQLSELAPAFNARRSSPFAAASPDRVLRARIRSLDLATVFDCRRRKPF